MSLELTDQEVLTMHDHLTLKPVATVHMADLESVTWDADSNTELARLAKTVYDVMKAQGQLVKAAQSEATMIRYSGQSRTVVLVALDKLREAFLYGYDPEAELGLPTHSTTVSDFE